MLLPLRTSIRPRRTPYANYAFIAINILIFFSQYGVDPITGGVGFRPWVRHFMLNPIRPQMWQFVSYAFLHGGLMHIIGNMFFLYLFGNNINDKLGHVGYVCFYLAGAVFAGTGHTLLSSSPVLGASGAVAAVTGAYLVLFPQTLITVIYWFFFIGRTELPAFYFILFKLIFWDNVVERRIPNVAYDAHLAGYAFGITAMLLMLAAGLIKTDSLDLWSMLKRWNRRRQYLDVVSTGYDPFTGLGPTKKIKAKEIKKSPVQKEKDEKIKNLRSQIPSRIAQRNLSAAAETYLELMEIDPKQIVPPQYLLDIANQLTSQSKHAEAAVAYEQLLTHYPTYEYIEQVQLMLGLIYSRYLNNPDLARKHLETAAKKLSDPAQLKLCNDALQKLS